MIPKARIRQTRARGEGNWQVDEASKSGACHGDASSPCPHDAMPTEAWAWHPSIQCCSISRTQSDSDAGGSGEVHDP